MHATTTTRTRGDILVGVGSGDTGARRLHRPSTVRLGDRGELTAV